MFDIPLPLPMPVIEVVGQIKNVVDEVPIYTISVGILPLIPLGAPT